LTVALLFDLDGTMVHTDPLHLAAFNLAVEPYGFRADLEYYKLKIMGRENRAIFSEVLPEADVAAWDAVADRKERAYRDMLGELAPNEGLLELLDWADAGGHPRAIVSNAPRENVERMLAGLRLRDRFPVVVLGDDLPHGKPHPLPYQTALARVGGTTERAVAFEDSLSGVRSASSAGIRTYGVMSALSERQLTEAGAAAAIRDFRDAGLWDHLRRLAGG
jgi:HAD superfamily hydrolase (TIGR01509 family)